MKQHYHIWVLGGDRRQRYLFRKLVEDGHSVHLYGLDSPDSEDSFSPLSGADCIIFPLPVAENGILYTPLSHLHPSLGDILPLLSPQQFLCGGNISTQISEEFLAHHLTIHDYFTQEELILSNAIPTAEGAIQLAMEQLPTTIHGSRVLILGFGRIGQCTAQRFAALGADVMVCARSNTQLALADNMMLHHQRLSQIDPILHSFDILINTIPALVLTRSRLECLNPDCLILDLASKPGGVDRTAARVLGCNVIHALGLPGQVAPATAAAAIQRTIYHMLSEYET